MDIRELLQKKTESNIENIERILGFRINRFRNNVQSMGSTKAIAELFNKEANIQSQAISLLTIKALEQGGRNLRAYLEFTAEFSILQSPFYQLFNNNILKIAKKRLDEHNFPFTEEEKVWISKLSVNKTIQSDLIIFDNGLKLAEEYFEGIGKQITVNSYERNPKARLKCLEIFGCDCSVCGFNFLAEYGEIGKDFIQVHHIESIASKNGEEYKINPEKDLIPVCPNCHSMLHRKTPPYLIEELKSIIRKCKS